jgi:nucleoside-diphosphate-sugar epimerase
MGNEGKINFVREKRNFNKVLMKKVKMSNKRAKKLMSYSPKVHIDEGLPLTISWYLNNEDVLSKSVREVPKIV